MRALLALFVGIIMLPLAASPAAAEVAAPPADAPVYMVSYIDVAPAPATARNQTATLLRQLATASRREEGNLRFEVLQRTAPQSQFVVLEIWKDQAAFDAHSNAEHTKAFRERVAPHLIAPIDDRLSVPTLVVPPAAARMTNPVYVVSHVDVPGNVRDKGLAALQALVEPSRKDNGNLRFDVTYERRRTNHFTVVEVWRNQAALDAHEVTAHTRDFRGALTPITGAMYDQRWYRPL